MGRIAGNFFAGLVFFFCVHTYTGVSVRVKDTDGASVEQVAAGQPFQVEVAIKDIAGSMVTPNLVHDEKMVLHKVGQQIVVTNGRTNQLHIFRARIDVPGTYTIGPATMMVGTEKHESEVISVRVGEKTIKRGKDAWAGQPKREELKLSLSSSDVMVGEKVEASLRFYTNEERVPDREFGRPVIDAAFSIRNLRGPHMGEELVDTIASPYVEWTWDMYPKKHGVQIVPAHSVDYELESRRRRNDMWGGFSFWGGHFQRKRTYSNAVRLVVAPLPSGVGELDAIGRFHEMRAEISPAVAKAGEGMVLKLDIDGEGDLEAISRFDLTDMPDELRWYPSKKTTLEGQGRDGGSIRRLEFIVQGLQEGNWQIPQQQFAYFDIESRELKKLTTTPLSLTITPGVTPQQLADNTAGSVGDDTSNELRPLHDPKEDSSVPFAGVGWNLFFMLLLLPFTFFGATALARRGKYYLNKHEKVWRARFALRNVRSALTKMESVYHALERYVADRTALQDGEVSLYDVERLLHEKGRSKTESSEWILFLNHISEAAFSEKGSHVSHQELVRQAHVWLDRLEGLL